ncbi:hypothetical protein NOR_00236 [Metarhizium rileyi]|uniref:Uncharacterized protein n=1 Tax=Metarhizium rileyi (strain RCEF 4871) TaxID=1649241 RepID=A0A167KEZ7_METRR|nr:hypothetical protein NOR_00236 [Metarhizium rileyi RCEF 4871]
MSSSNTDDIASQTSSSSDGGSVAVGIVLGILAGIFVVLVLLSRNRGNSYQEDVEAGKRRRLASIVKLDGVAPSRAYGDDQEKIKPEPRSSSSFENVLVWYVSLPQK